MLIEEIAGYRVVRELGAGGMGQVFLVEHPRLPRLDALKLLDARVSRNDDFKMRFQREADLLAQLSHPNIVTLYDRGEFEDRLWLSMEYVDGTDAAELLEGNSPLDPDLVIQLISGAGAALDYAWRKHRITHRDVKPANILVGIDDSDGERRIESVKLADFGIAKAAGEATSLTSTGFTIGTLQYISPEALDGEELDNRADVYSLGCTAFHLLSGYAPYAGRSMTALVTAHLTHEPPRLAAMAPQRFPSSVDAVFERVLAKHPDDRYETCGDFVGALQESLRGGGPSAYEPTLPAIKQPDRTRPLSATQTLVRGDDAEENRPRPRVWPLIAAAVAVVVGVVAGLSIYLVQSVNRDEQTAVAGTSTSPAQVPARSMTTSASAPVTTPAAPTTVATPAAPTLERTVTPTAEPTVTEPPIASPPAPYEGMPCTEWNQVSSDGTLFCSAMTGAWRDRTHQNRPAVEAGSGCTEPGARARVNATDAIATCRPSNAGGYTWQY